MSKSSKEGKHRRDILNTSPLRPSTRMKLEQRLSEPVAPLKDQKHIVSAQQWTFIQELISNDGHITLTEAAIRAGYPKESASSIGSELTDPKKKPHVVAAIQQYRAELAEKYGTNFDRHMRDLQHIRDQALEAGNFGAAVSAEYRRGQALGTIYVDRKEIRVGTIDSMSKDEVRRKLEEIKALYGAPPQTLIDIEPEEIEAEEIEAEEIEPEEVEETPPAKTIIEEMRDVERSRVSAIQKRKEETRRRFGSAIRKQGEPRDTGLPDSDAADILDVGAQGGEEWEESTPEPSPDSLRPEAWIDGDANLHTGAVAPKGDDEGL
jgi:phage terminase small subunit